MNTIGSQKALLPSAPHPPPTPKPSPEPEPPPKAPLPYFGLQMFRKLENGTYAITGSTGDIWDIARAPVWRSKSKVLDPFLIQASNILGSGALALNIANNAAGRVFEISAAVDEVLKATIGVDFDTLTILAQTSTPGNPLDDLPPYLLARAAEISRFAKKSVFREKLVLVAESLDHIQTNHGWQNLQLPKSRFFPHIDVPKLIKSAESLPKIPQKGRKFARIAAAKEIVGLDRVSGAPTKIYTVVSDAWGEVVTTHPGLPDPHFSLP